MQYLEKYLKPIVVLSYCCNQKNYYKVELLLNAIVDLKKKIGIPTSIREYGIDEKEFKDNLDQLVRLAFDDQCTGANPVFPLMSEIKQIYLDAYEGKF